MTLDADLSHDPRDIPRLVAALDAGADAAFGSRFMPGSQLDYQGWRLFLSNTANHLARTLLKLPISEYTSSFRAARLKHIPVGLIETIPKDGYEFFLTAAVRLARLNIRITEIPIHFRDRHSGVSKIPKLEILRGAANLMRLYFTRQTHDLSEPAKQLLSQWTQLIERQAVVRHESQ